MVVKQAQLDYVKGNFVLEKDTAYQEVGNYFYPTQTVEKNIGRSFLRGQVNEQGEMSLTSIYCAGGTLHHTAVKVSVGGIPLPKLPPRKTAMKPLTWAVQSERPITRWGKTAALSLLL